MISPLLTHQVDGAGDAVLLLNGELMTMASWEPIAAGLMVSRRVIRCDFRGQLLSPGVAPLTFDEHVRDLEQLLDALDVPVVHVIGTSFGALAALCLASTRPERVRSVIAAQATAYCDAEALARLEDVIGACRVAALGDGGGDVVFDLMSERLFSDAYVNEHAGIFDLRRQAFEGFPSEYYEGMLRMFGIMIAADLRSNLPRVVAPTLVVESSADLMFPAPASSELAQGIRGAEVITLAGATHGILVENPPQLFAVIQEFLARHSD